MGLTGDTARDIQHLVMFRDLYNRVEENKLRLIEDEAQLKELMAMKILDFKGTSTIGVLNTVPAQKGNANFNGTYFYTEGFGALKGTKVKVGDVWNVSDSGASENSQTDETNVVWVGDRWDNFASSIDLSGYLTKTDAKVQFDSVNQILSQLNSSSHGANGVSVPAVNTIGPNDIVVVSNVATNSFGHVTSVQKSKLNIPTGSGPTWVLLWSGSRTLTNSLQVTTNAVSSYDNFTLGVSSAYSGLVIAYGTTARITQNAIDYGTNLTTAYDFAYLSAINGLGRYDGKSNTKKGNTYSGGTTSFVLGYQNGTVSFAPRGGVATTIYRIYGIL